MVNSFDPHEPDSLMASRSVQPFLHSLPMCPRQTGIQTTLRVTSAAIGRIYALRSGDAA